MQAAPISMQAKAAQAKHTTTFRSEKERKRIETLRTAE